MLPDNDPQEYLVTRRSPVDSTGSKGTEISPAIIPNAKPIDQLSTEPTRYQRREQANHLEPKREIRTIPGLVNHRKPGRRSRC
jgi:hypothetical protein